MTEGQYFQHVTWQGKAMSKGTKERHTKLVSHCWAVGMMPKDLHQRPPMISSKQQPPPLDRPHHPHTLVYCKMKIFFICTTMQPVINTFMQIPEEKRCSLSLFNMKTQQFRPQGLEGDFIKNMIVNSRLNPKVQW